MVVDWFCGFPGQILLLVWESGVAIRHHKQNDILVVQLYIKFCVFSLNFDQQNIGFLNNEVLITALNEPPYTQLKLHNPARIQWQQLSRATKNAPMQHLAMQITFPFRSPPSCCCCCCIVRESSCPHPSRLYCHCTICGFSSLLCGWWWRCLLPVLDDEAPIAAIGSQSSNSEGRNLRDVCLKVEILQQR